MPAVPIIVGRLRNGEQPLIRRFKEKATQTFKVGTPVLVEAASGYLIESPAINDGTDLVMGIALEAGANLTSSGVAQTLTQGSVQNQTNAKIIPGGVAPNDGMCGVAIAQDDVEFKISYKAAQTPAITDIGLVYGMVKNANGYWEIDTAIATAAAGACVEVVELLEATPTAGGPVLARFVGDRQQYNKRVGA